MSDFETTHPPAHGANRPDAVAGRQPGRGPNRNIIVHYHIFKNAGSTLDSMLEHQFAKGWVNFDRTAAATYITPAELAEYILAHPKLSAVSSHQAVFPVPEIPGVNVIPAVFIRHPLDRVRSVYEFERRQGQTSGPVSKGADHASRLPLREYLRWRLDMTLNGVVHNFQTVRLIHSPRYNKHPIKDADFDLAWSRLLALPFFGLVEHFDSSIVLFSKLLARNGISFATDFVAHNQSAREGSLQDRLDRMRHDVGDAMWEELLARNQRDLHLYERAAREFDARVRASQPR